MAYPVGAVERAMKDVVESRSLSEEISTELIVVRQFRCIFVLEPSRYKQLCQFRRGELHATFMSRVNEGAEPPHILRMPIPGSADVGKLIEIIPGLLRQPSHLSPPRLLWSGRFNA